MIHWDNLSLENLEETVDGILYKEEWVSLKEFNDLYLISSFGRVKSVGCFFKVIGVRILRQGKDRDGYPQVALRKDKKSYPKKVHRLVALYFIENPENKPQVNHKLGIKADNRFHQLEWATTQEDVIHQYEVLGRKGKTNMKGRLGDKHPGSKKLQQKTQEGVVLGTYNGTAEAARITGYQRRGIGKACFGTRKTYMGFKWEYI